MNEKDSINSNSPREDSLYMLDTPEDLLRYYRKYPIPELSFFGLIMNCVLTHSVAEVVQCIPTDLFHQFEEMVSGVASLSRDEDFIVIGHPVKWGIKEAKRVVQWLGDHPNPDLAPDM